MALLDWRNTPGDIVKSSPSQILYGRRTRTLLPLTSKMLEPSAIPTFVARKDIQKRKEKERQYYNRGFKILVSVWTVL